MAFDAGPRRVFGDAEVIPVLSVRQPWAGLIRLGVKTIEVRSRRIHHRGPIAICATAQPDAEAVERLRAALVPGALAASAFDAACGLASCICAVVNVTGCRLMTQADAERALWWDDQLGPNRFAWLLSDIRPTTPLPWKGSQGWQRLDRSLGEKIANVCEAT